jgi:uncharacterized delta-60 repeat protein
MGLGELIGLKAIGRGVRRGRRGMRKVAMCEPLEGRVMLAAGDADATFGSAGAVSTDIAGTLDVAMDLAIQSDGKIIAVGSASPNNNFGGDVALVRYNSNGSLDTTFGGSGKVRSDFGNKEYIDAVVIQNDGKIVVGGCMEYANYDQDFLLVRYNENGTLDGSFGVGGKVTLDFGSHGTDWVHELLLQPDGKIIAVGEGTSGFNAFGLARYDSNGTLDATFGTAGKVITIVGGNSSSANAAVLQSDGKILVAGEGPGGGGFISVAAVRYLANGSKDPSFGSGGEMIDNVGITEAQGVAVGLDGNIYLAAAINDTKLTQLFSYTTSGVKRTSFGTGGALTIAPGGWLGSRLGVVAQPDGKIVAAVTSNSTGGYFGNWTIARVSPAGVFDATFGTNGKVTTTAGDPTRAEVHAVGLQADGKLVVAGYASWNMRVARYLADPVALGPTGQVIVTGTAGGDQIDLQNNQPGYLDIALNGAWYQFPLTAVNNIQIDGSSGMDALSIGSGVGKPVSFNGGGDYDILSFNASANADVLDITSASVAGGGNAADFLNIEFLNVLGRGGPDTYNVTGTPVGAGVRLNDSAGNNSFNLLSAANGATIQIFGGSGDDTVNYELVGSFNVSFDGYTGVDTLNVNAGIYTIDWNELGQTPVDIVRVNLDGGGTATAILNNNLRFSALEIGAAGTAVFSSSAGMVLRTSGLSLAGSGKLDMKKNALIVDYAAGSPLLQVKGWISTAWNGGAWDGNGITTSLGDGRRCGLGYGEASVVLGPAGGTFLGEVVDGTTVLVRFTLYGDTNLDQMVDIIDLGKVGTNWQKSGWWTEGDSDYSGFVDIVDLGRVGTNWQVSVPGVPASIWTDLARLKRRGPRKGV